MEYKPGQPPPYSQQMAPPTMIASAPPMMIQGPPMFAVGVAPTVILQQPLGPRSTVIVCKSCNKRVETRVDYQPTTKTHIFALILCLVGCCLCACVPYCVDSCQAANHYCPSCNCFLGSYNS